jgi:hypothetical protein
MKGDSVPSTLEIIILILAVVAAIRLFQVKGSWGWPAGVLVAGVALLYFSGRILVPILGIFWGPTRVSLNPEMVIATASKLVIAVEFTAAVLLGVMAAIPAKFNENPKRYLLRGLLVGLGVWILIGILF